MASVFVYLLARPNTLGLLPEPSTETEPATENPTEPVTEPVTEPPTEPELGTEPSTEPLDALQWESLDELAEAGRVLLEGDQQDDTDDSVLLEGDQQNG
jgi:hypothetical protein